MSIITKVSEDVYTVGTYTITKQEDKWLVVDSKNDDSKALYFTKRGALHDVVLLYTCGRMVQDGIRELIVLTATEMHPEWELDK
jgi:hypothetical protein